jgi:DNA-binding beta-propeller fold protein YncE/mono/diheme cytochrome c family protein
MRNRSLLALSLTVAACSARVEVGAPSPVASVATTTSSTTSPAPLPTRAGSAIARSVRGDALWIADEDHRVVRRASLPVDAARMAEFPMPGAPAQVLPIGGRVLVTIRDPGLLLVLREDASAGLVEDSRIPLPADAWGLAVDASATTAYVTSAWTHQVSAIDLASGRLRWSVDVAREPRGVVVTEAGVVYVSHLVGADLTRIDDRDLPEVRRVKLPAAPLRAPLGATIEASLGYALALSTDETRLFAPRHALGAMGERSWYGAPTIDVLHTGDDHPMLGGRSTHYVVSVHTDALQIGEAVEKFGPMPFVTNPSMTQPRAVAVRHSEGTLLVAGEGDDSLVEVAMDAIDPALKPRHTYALGRGRDPIQNARFCGAPSGVALSADERTAYVFCRSTYDLAIVALHTPNVPHTGAVAGLKLADDPLPAEAEAGRRTFYNATDDIVSGGLACAGCHPEGRDDGHTWHEVDNPVLGHTGFVAHERNITFEKAREGAGYAVQTPMLAGRVEAAGPYGWHAQNRDLADRAMDGMKLHRWDGGTDDVPTRRLRATGLASFLRTGLVPPPKPARELSAIEQRGRDVFSSDDAGCAGCHVPATGYTDRVAYPLAKVPTPPGFVDDPDVAYKTPDLRFVDGTPPYLHDGSARTLEELVEGNGHRMGRTEHLSKDDRAALVAFLKTL